MRLLRSARFCCLVLYLIASSLVFADAGGSTSRIAFRSALLSQFWGKRIEIRALVYVPAYCASAKVTCPVLFHFPGYGASLSQSARYLAEYQALGNRRPGFDISHVFLDTEFLGGYNYFTDSENYGPWSSALVEEFIPYLESTFNIAGDPHERFLIGVSSGGWAAVWQQVSNAGVFNGVWAAAPDPLDFTFFYRTDVTPGSIDNFYHFPNRKTKTLIRGGAQSLRAFMRTEDNSPSQGGLISSYEFAWSKRLETGLPERLFDRTTGSLNQETLTSWSAFDVRTVIASLDGDARSQLASKLTLFVGSIDTFFYNLPTSSLCRYFQRIHLAEVCHVIPGRGHSDIVQASRFYPAGFSYFAVSRVVMRWRKWARSSD